jgi:hypothetical protein
MIINRNSLQIIRAFYIIVFQRIKLLKVSFFASKRLLYVVKHRKWNQKNALQHITRAKGLQSKSFILF